MANKPAAADRERPPAVRRDALDAADFERLAAESQALERLIANGSRLLPDFRELVGDLYSACVKLVVELVPASELPPSAQLRARLVDSVTESAAYRAFWEVSQLRPDRAGLGAFKLGTAVLAELKAGRLMLPAELRSSWEADALEDQLQTLEDEADAAEALADARTDELMQRIAKAEAADLRDAADAQREEIEQLRGELVEAAEQVPNESLQRLNSLMDGLPERLEELTEGEEALGGDAEPGPGDGAGDAVDALALGDKLSKNRLLQKLARLVGALRAEALAERRKRVPRAQSEVYGVRTGRDIAHLLPAELMTLRHPLLKWDFRRRLVEGRLMTYAVRGDDREGRGPAVILLDVSGSMAGDKAIWAKAVALTLADLARRGGRAVTVITFSAGAGSVRPHELVPDRRYRGRRPLDRAALLSFVETRVGGGTDFAGPLATAEELIRHARRSRRGDVVLITDGEAQLGARRIEAFEAFKRETDSRCIGVVVDVSDHRLDILERICDRIASVKELTAAGARQVFRAFR